LTQTFSMQPGWPWTYYVAQVDSKLSILPSARKGLFWVFILTPALSIGIGAQWVINEC
jgi:hypothetical protein